MPGFGFGFTGAIYFYPIGRWNPSYVNNVALWVRGETLGADGTDISQWTDESGNFNHLVQSVAVDRPVVSINELDGISGADFDGVSEALDLTSDLVFSDEYYIFVVYKAALSTNYAPLSGDASTERPFFVAYAAAQMWANNAGGAVTISAASEVIADTFTLYEVSRGASDGIFPYENGTDIRDGTPSSSGQTAIRHMAQRSSEFMPGTVCEAIVVVGNMTPEERIATYGYLAGKYPSLSITVPGGGGPTGDYLVTVGGDPIVTVGGDYIGPW